MSLPLSLDPPLLDRPLFRAVTLGQAVWPLLSAGLLALAAPPFDLWPLALVALVPLYWQIRDATPWQAAGAAWLTACVAYLLTTAGWGVPLLIEFAHMTPLGSVVLVVLNCAYQGLVMALWAGGCAFLARRVGLSWLWSAPLMLVLAESVVPFIFPAYLGLLVWRAWPLIQVAELGGPTAVSALVVLINLVGAEGVPALVRRARPTRAVRVGALVLSVLIGGGLVRAAQVEALRAQAPRLRVGLVQPNFGVTSVLSRILHGDAHIVVLRAATQALATEPVDLYVWSESAWPYLFDRNLTQAFPPGHPWEMDPGVTGRLLVGMLTHPFGNTRAVFNSASLFSANGALAGRYDKMQLTPFSEYVPFAERYPQAAQAVRARLPDWPELTPGAAPTLLVDGPVRIETFICSEELNAQHVWALARLGPNVLVTLASDAWFGASAGARQHFAQVVFRAVETRRDLVRASNTGVSGTVDALGRVMVEGPLVAVPRDAPASATVLRGEVALADTWALAPFAGEYFPVACLVVLGLGVLWAAGVRRWS